MNRFNHHNRGGGGGRYCWNRAAPASFNSHRHRRPPDPSPNFIIELRAENFFSRSEVARFINQCSARGYKYEVYNCGSVAGRIMYSEWSFALEGVVELWERKFEGECGGMVPVLVSNMDVASDWVELEERLRGLFVGKVKGLVDGEVVRRWKKKVDSLTDRIGEVSGLLRRRQGHRVGVFEGLVKKKEGLVAERKLIDDRVKEFRAGLGCIVDHLEGRGLKEVGDDVRVFGFKDGFDWCRIYHLVMRECRRIDGSLPIYGFRREILKQISTKQIIVMVGETGSGKSTQLVQFLADSGVFSDGCIVCTQPRKVAAISLADRVGKESSGCYGGRSVGCYPSYSSAQSFNEEVAFMTDHCLLQHCMNNDNLSGISCIIVDEAHERSLNTDLLLALLKKLLLRRLDLRLIIMSATADADQLSQYFFGCGTLKVVGRTFPVAVKYVPNVSDGTSDCMKADSAVVASYVTDVVKMATQIHRTEGEGAILAFLTSQVEVELACDLFCAQPTVAQHMVVALALHGKLSYEDQSRVFKNDPGQRKVIFATNVAETSLTIPGVKYVIDCGLAKGSRFEPGTGMNVLRVGWISRSSADQRSGRAGRTEPGQCYRLYSQDDLEFMPAYQEPEIRRVHLGIAVLKILALGVKRIQEFDFIDAPSPEAIELALQNLIQLGAVTSKHGFTELTEEGRLLVKLGIEPRLGKLILNCYHESLGKEGLVLATVMANSGSIFCRVGKEEDKQKSDCLKVPFCHRDGDLFTLLSVYKEWEKVPDKNKSTWCWENSINAKSMRRCQDAFKELENCLKNELSIIIPSYWNWRPDVVTDHDKYLKKAILSSLAENVAMYSGYDHLGYQVALTGKHVRLHPSCSLLMFTNKPKWVIFGNILSASHEYLVCVTAVDFEFLSTLSPPPLFDVFEMDNKKLQVRLLVGFSSRVLKRFCGKSNNGLFTFLSYIRNIYHDERIGIEVNADNNEIQLFASSRDMEMVSNDVKAALNRERWRLQNECMKKFLHYGGPVALLGAGAQIKHLELDKRCLTVDICCSDVTAVTEKDVLICLGKHADGLCDVHKFRSHGLDTEDKRKWGTVTFVTPDAANSASMLRDIKIGEVSLSLNLSKAAFEMDRSSSASKLKAKVFWPRRCSRGRGIVRCENKDVYFMVDDFYNLVIGGKPVRCRVGTRSLGTVEIHGIDPDLDEHEILDVLKNATNCPILSFFLVRGDAVTDPSPDVCKQALLREISLFLPRRSPHVCSCEVRVFEPKPLDFYMNAAIEFDGRLPLEAARALEQIEGKVLQGCRPWQKIRNRQLFRSSLSCPSSIYHVIETELRDLIDSLKKREGVEIFIDKNLNGSVWLNITANATKTVAEVRGPLEQLMKGKTITNTSLTQAVLQPLFSRDGIDLMRSIQLETGAYVLFDRQLLNVRLFGTKERVAAAEQRLIQRLLALYEDKPMEIRLRGSGLPHDLMKLVVKALGPDLCGIKEKVPDADVKLNTRYHVIRIRGDQESKQKVEEIVHEIAQTSCPDQTHDNESACPICLCEVEDKYQLDNCLHYFCRQCLVEQFESAIRNFDSFPMCCAHEGCGAPIWLSDLRALLSAEKLEELFRSSLAAFVATSGGKYRFCPSPDCPSVYRVSTGPYSEPFLCGACYVKTCTRCHLEDHEFISCEKYREFKEDPDLSLKEWVKGRDHVKACPMCGCTIEKHDGCDHLECRCGTHFCWICLKQYTSSQECYDHLQSVHQGIVID
ncbi:hypothetical protein Drorol1_Dr00021901 [Drosera rotundifolia]